MAVAAAAAVSKPATPLPLPPRFGFKMTGPSPNRSNNRDIAGKPNPTKVRGTVIPAASRAAYWAALFTSNCRARLPLITRRPCRSSQASVILVNSGTRS